MRAVESGNLSEVTKLLKEGADINATSNNGNSALHLAIEQQQVTIFSVLISTYAHSIDIKAIYNNQNILEHAATMFASQNNHEKAYLICNIILTRCMHAKYILDPNNAIMTPLRKQLDEMQRPLGTDKHYHFKVTYHNNVEVVTKLPIHRFTGGLIKTSTLAQPIANPELVNNTLIPAWINNCLPQCIRDTIDNCTRSIHDERSKALHQKLD
jgi:hypothetical protein